MRLSPGGGCRHAELAAGILHQNRGYDTLRVIRKGGRHDALAIHPNTVKRLKDYLVAAGHADDLDGPLFRPLSHNRKQQETRRHMHPDAIDRVLRKYAKAIGLDRGYSAHSMRATFITTALENGCSLEDVQRAAGHREPSTTKRYESARVQSGEVGELFCDALRIQLSTATFLVRITRPTVSIA